MGCVVREVDKNKRFSSAISTANNSTRWRQRRNWQISWKFANEKDFVAVLSASRADNQVVIVWFWSRHPLRRWKKKTKAPHSFSRLPNEQNLIEMLIFHRELVIGSLSLSISRTHSQGFSTLSRSISHSRVFFLQKSRRLFSPVLSLSVF